MREEDNSTYQSVVMIYEDNISTSIRLTFQRVAGQVYLDDLGQIHLFAIICHRCQVVYHPTADPVVPHVGFLCDMLSVSVSRWFHSKVHHTGQWSIGVVWLFHPA